MNGIIDAHTHVWRRDTGDYTWLTPEVDLINRDFSLDDFAAERAATGIDGVVLVQAADTAGDTDRMLTAAERYPEVLGVVAWLPLAGPRLDEVIADRLATGRVVGMRALIHHLDDAQWVLRPEVSAGLDAIAGAGLPFDFVTSGPEALALVPDLVQRHPLLHVIINHLGKPPVGGGAVALARWARLLREAARSPRVAAKLSGLGAAAGPLDATTVSDLEPVVGEALETFGSERLMYGSDWPVSILTGGCARAFECLHEALDAVGASPLELQQIHRRTATTWYRLEERKR